MVHQMIDIETPESIKLMAGELENLPQHTMGCPNDCLVCIAAETLQELADFYFANKP